MQSDSTSDISRVKGWAEKLSVFRSFVTEALLVCLFAVGVFFTIAEFRRENVVIDVIEIPKALSDKLSTNVAITRQLVDAAEMIAQKRFHEGSYPLALLHSDEQENPCFDENQFEAVRQKGKGELKKCNEARPPTTDTAGLFSGSIAMGIEPLMRLDADEPDIEVPAFGSLRSTIRLLKEAIGIQETHITGEITQKDDTVYLVLRSNEAYAVRPGPISDTGITQELIDSGGRALIQLHMPCIAASYYYREELGWKKFRTTKRLIEPCRKRNEFFADLISGLIEYEVDDIDQAIAHFRRAIQRNAKRPDAYFHLGRALQRKALPDRARAAYKNAIAADPDYVEAYVGLASLLADADRRADAVEALQNLEHLIERNPQKGADILVYWGNGLLNLNLPNQAAGKYQQAIDAEKQHVVARNNWGVVMYSQADFSGALEKYKEAIDLDRSYREAFLNYGMAMIELSPDKNREDRFREAVLLYKEAIKRDPTFNMAHYFSAIANLRLAMLERDAAASQAAANEAQADFGQFKKSLDKESREKSADLFNHWGNALLVLAKQRSVNPQRAKKYRTAAIRAYENAIKSTRQRSDYYYPYFNQSIAYFLLGEKAEGEQRYRDALDAIKAHAQRYQAVNLQAQTPAPSADAEGDRLEKAFWLPETDPFSLDGNATSAPPLVPERLIWPITGGFAVLLIGLSLITVRNLRKAKTVEPPKPQAGRTPPLSRPVGGNVAVEMPPVRRRTKVEGGFPTPDVMGPGASLRCDSGPMRNRHFSIEKASMTIGANEENDICLADDEYVSGKHASLRSENGRLFIIDHASRNGTFLNGERLAGAPRALKQGDRVQIGTTVFEVLMG